MLKTDTNPQGTPIEAFDAIRAGVSGDRSQFYQDLSEPFYGANRPGNQVSQGMRDSFWLWSLQVALKGAYDCIKAFSETDLTEDLRRIEVPTLIVHGDDDQIVPIGASAMLSSKLVKYATLTVYPGARRSGQEGWEEVTDNALAWATEHAAKPIAEAAR